MSLFNPFSWFDVQTKEDPRTGLILISNIDTGKFIRDIEKVYNTNGICKYMFTNIKKYSFTIEPFYVPDLYYSASTLLDFKKMTTKKSNIKELLKGLKENTWFARYFVEYPDILNFSKLSEMKFSPLPIQLGAFKAYNEKVPKLDLRGYLLAAGVGSGKLQPLDSFIKVPQGWRLMGDMKIGDDIIAWDGTTSKVNGVYPHGFKDIYKLTFSDGRSAEAGGEHLWKVYNKDWVKKTKVITTLELLESMEKSNYRKVHYIDLCESEQSPDIQNLPLHPYVLGVLLGNGYIGDKSNSIELITPDDHIVEKVRSLLPKEITLKYHTGMVYRFINNKEIVITKPNVLKEILKNLNLYGKLSNTKHIPEIYLNGSTQQRLELLQGLMDTDGCVALNDNITYCSVSLELANHVQYLVRSLGGIASIYTRQPSYMYHGKKTFTKLTYTINIRYKRPNELFTLPKKKDRLNEKNQYFDFLKLRVEKIEYIGKKETQCISIDHPDHLYITNDFIVTHNTYMSLSLAAMLEGDPVFIICPKSLIDKVWVDEIKMHYKKPRSVWKSNADEPLKTGYDFYIIHYNYLGKALDFVKRNRFKKPIILLDEAHNLSEVKSLRVKIYLDFCKHVNSNNIIHLSGTSVRALASDTIPLFRVIDKRWNTNVEESFKKIYGRSLSRAFAILNNRIDMISHKIDSADVMGDTPKPIIKQVKVKLKNGDKYTIGSIRQSLVSFSKERNAFYQKHMKEYVSTYERCVNIYEKTIRYDSDKRDFGQYKSYISKIRDHSDPQTMGTMSQWCNSFEKNKIIPVLSSADKKLFRDAKSVYKYLSLKILGEFLGGVVSKLREELTTELTLNCNLEKYILEADKKTIIFTDYIPTLLATEQYLKHKGFSPVLIYGETNKDAGKIIDSYKNDPKINPIMATYRTMGAGVTLLCSNTTIFLNYPFRSADLIQAQARNYRFGVTGQVFYFELVLDTGKELNLSTRAEEIMNWSASMVDAILGKNSIIVDKDLNKDIFIKNALTNTHESFFSKFKRNMKLKF